MLLQVVNEWQQCAEFVGAGFQYNDCYREVYHVLLVRKVLVDGEKCVKFLGRKSQESAVLTPPQPISTTVLTE